jgi:TonB family protein
MRATTISLVLIASLLLRPNHLLSQRGREVVEVGNFIAVLETDTDTAGRDSSFLWMWPDSISARTPPGTAVWACGGDSTGMSGGLLLPMWGVVGASRRVALRFDGGQPDTLVLDGQAEDEFMSTLWFLREQDVTPVLRRAVAANGLTIEVLDTFNAWGPTRYSYALAGLDSMLHRLGCPVTPPTPGNRSGRGIVRVRVPGGTLSQPEGSSHARPGDPGAMRAYARLHYPDSLRAARVEGEVVVRVRVTEFGGVDPAKIRVVWSTHAGFEAVATAAVLRLRFTPASVDDRPVSDAPAEVSVVFSLSPDPATATSEQSSPSVPPADFISP